MNGISGSYSSLKQINAPKAISTACCSQISFGKSEDTVELSSTEKPKQSFWQKTLSFAKKVVSALVKAYNMIKDLVLSKKKETKETESASQPEQESKTEQKTPEKTQLEIEQEEREKEIARNKALIEQLEQEQAERQARAEAEAKAQAEREAKAQAEAEAKAKAEEEARLAAEEEAKIKAQKEAEAKDQALKEQDERAYQKVLKNMEHAKVINKQVDEIMARPDFEEKIEELMNIKFHSEKSRYDCTREETTLNEIFKSSILGEYTEPVDEIYHGTNSGSYKDIMQNGFSKDACSINESGRGIYFGLSKDGAEGYSKGGGLIKAKYKGGKIAKVEAGVISNRENHIPVAKFFEKELGVPYVSKDSQEIRAEILFRMYTKMLNSMGYDAVCTASRGAGCKYICVLDPKDIEIVK